MSVKAMRWSAVRTAATAAVALLVAGLLAGCFDSTSEVDAKVELNLPDGAGVCYMLEVDHFNGGGGEEGEQFYCAPKAEWDKNRVGEVWVDAAGKRK